MRRIPPTTSRALAPYYQKLAAPHAIRLTQIVHDARHDILYVQQIRAGETALSEVIKHYATLIREERLLDKEDTADFLKVLLAQTTTHSQTATHRG
jgi:hypothetical protein